MPDIVTTNGYSNSISVHRSGIDNSFTVNVGSTDTLVCAGGFINVPVVANGPYDANNIFTVELSDASGSFANPVIIGSAAAFSSITITCTVPLGTVAGTGYRIRIISTSPQALVRNPGASITITSALPASVTISASPGDSVCAGTVISFTATPVNGGSSPTYQWVRNGNNVGANNPVYTSSFSNNDQIACIMTSQMGVCATNNPAVSNVITMTVVPLPTQPGSITGSATACTYQATTYSVPAVPGATSYVWSLPSGWTGTSTTNSITVIPGPSSGTISVSAANGCGSSNVRTRSVSSAFPPTIANADPDQTVCTTSATLQGNIPGSGRIMDTYQYSGSTYQVNIEHYAPGPYLFLIRTDGNLHRFTVIRHQ